MRKKLLVIGIGIIVLLILWAGISIYPDWLWFGNLGFAPVFWTMILSKFGFGALIWVLLMIILCANLYAVRKFNPIAVSREGLQGSDRNIGPMGLSGNALNTLLLAFILILSFLLITPINSASFPG